MWSRFHYRRGFLIFAPKGDSIFPGKSLYKCPRKDKSGTKSSHGLSHKTCTLGRNLWRTVSQKLAQGCPAGKHQGWIGIKVITINAMISPVLCPDTRFKFVLIPKTTAPPIRVFSFDVPAHVRQPSSTPGLLLHVLGPSSNRRLYSCGVSGHVPQGWSVRLGPWLSSTVPGIPLSCPGPLMASTVPGSLCLLSQMYLVQLSHLKKHLDADLPTRTFILKLPLLF